MSIEGTLPGAVLDVENTLIRLGGDRQLFVDMTTFVLEDSPPLFEKLSDAVSHGDAMAVEKIAHALKGLLANGGGIRAAKAVESLEDAGRKRDISKAEPLLEPLAAELEALTDAIRAYQA